MDNVYMAKAKAQAIDHIKIGEFKLYISLKLVIIRFYSNLSNYIFIYLISCIYR